ncbi:uncharacterized protein [Amphiura filiformis]|uniref:uncharacterized protein n=1 Tax=Amphiura filiformis TaxID=82378 RepID=UPI003B21CA6C
MADRRNDLPIEEYGCLPSKPGVKLDLYNFESTYAEDSPYVLTSPRSLEACAQLDIKPVELILKPVSDFEEDCLLSGQPIGYARHMYEAYETNRLEKLRFCRQIRERIILEDDNQSDPEEIGEPTYEDRVRSRGPSTTLSLSSSLKHSPREVKHISVVEFGQGDHTEDSHLHTQTEKQLAEDNKSTTIPHMRQTPTSAKVGKKAKQRSNSAQGSYSAQRSNSAQKSKSAQRSYSARKASSARRRSNSFGSTPNTSMMSMTSSKSYGSGRVSRMASVDLLSDRDKRILDLLETKHLVKQAEEQVKHISRLAWEEEKAIDEANKEEAERQRRQKLIEATARRQRKEERRGRQRLEEESSSLELTQQQLLHDEEKHKRLLETQNKLKTLEIHHRKMQQLEKKRRQERHLEDREKDEEEFRQTVVANQQRSIERATDVKQRKELFELKERQRRNAVERARHETLRDSVNKQSEEYTEQMQHFLHVKHDRSERSLQSQTRYKEQQLQYQRERALVKLADWKRHLIVKGRKSQERAVEQASQTSLHKARKACDVRRSREKLHKELLDRVKEDEEAEKEYIKEKIAYKDYKTRVHSNEKNRSMQRSREIAKVSAEFRDNIRKQYSGTFDKMVRRAQLESRVGLGPQSAYKNCSTPGLF